MPDQLPQRIPEPELMDEPQQAAAYAGADFEQPHSRFMTLLRQSMNAPAFAGRLADLGCGTGDITLRLARAFPRCRIDAIDGAAAMLSHADTAVRAAGLAERVRLVHGRLPEAVLPEAGYEAVISNSLLHHLHDPLVLWDTVRRIAAPGCHIFVMDLMRPESRAQAQDLVDTHSGSEPEILRRDFFNSLLAAFRPGEIERQLGEAGISGLEVRVVSDRHLTIHGQMS